MAAVPSLESDQHPLLFDHYLVERILGTGAMGVVYLARDQRIGRQVALKTLHQRRQLSEGEAAEEFIQRFRREAQLCGSLLHPNIVTLYEIGQEGQRFTYLAMEYIEGESLLSLIRRKQWLPIDAACRIGIDLLQALAHAHDRGIIHRDIKPANVLVSIDGQAKISDFGIARLARADSSDLTENGRLLGTPHYMAPEHISGKQIDTRADLFSMGVLMFEMLTGRKPFEGAGLTDVLFNVVNEPTPSIVALNPEVPAWCVEFVERLLAKSPDDRYPSAAVAARELRRLFREHGNFDELPEIDLSIVRERTADDTPTTPIIATLMERPRRSILQKPVSRIAAFGLIAGSVAIAGALIVGIARQIDERPTSFIHPQQVAAFEEKRERLQHAALLFEAGALEESAALYRQLVADYPDNVPAREGLRRVDAAIQEELRAQQSEERRITPARVTAPGTTVKVTKNKENISWWKRLINKFRRR